MGVYSMKPTMHGHRQTKLFARYVLLVPVPIHSNPALMTSASLLPTAFLVPGQIPYILTRLIRTLKSFFVSVGMKSPKPSLTYHYLLAASIINFSSDILGLAQDILSFHSMYT